MRSQFCARWGLLAVTAIGFLAVSACGSKEPKPAASLLEGVGVPSGARGGQAVAPKNEIPSGELPAVMADHYRGLGHMERYEYREAIVAFREVRKRCAGWIPGSINLAIALLER